MARSSFGLDAQFRTVGDVLSFVPVSLSHYFLGPFIWEVVDVMQALSLIETFAVYLLLYPCLIGIRSLYNKNRTATCILITFIFFFVSAQSIVISNMGTIFRHRTLTFLFLSMFVGEGLSVLFERRSHWASLRFLQRFATFST